MVALCYLVLLIHATSSRVAGATSQAAVDSTNQARRLLGGQGVSPSRAAASSPFNPHHGRAVDVADDAANDASYASWREERPRGRTLAGKRKRRSPFHPNRPSTYASLGAVRPFTGDVYPSAALLPALEARSFRQELILITDTRPRAALQLYDNLAQLGLVHVLWLTNAQSICAAADELLAARASLRGHAQQAAASGGAAAGGAGAAAVSWRRALQEAAPLGPFEFNVSAAMAMLAAASEAGAVRRYSSLSDLSTEPAPVATTSADVGCAWYSQSFPDLFVGHRRLMMRRMMLLARVVRLGFNVLSLDTDVIVFREPYTFLKSPPYGAAHMVVGRSVRGGSMVNTGVMYFQNASRAGPVSWLLTEAVERNLRWLEYTPPPVATAATSTAAAAATPLMAPPEAEKRGCWDQFLFADSLLTAITGKLSLYYCARPPERLLAAVARVGGSRRGEEDTGWNTRHRAALGLVDRQSPAELFMRDVTLVNDTELLNVVAGESFVTSWGNLTIPRNPPPLLADEPGYALPPRVAGGRAAQFLQLLEEDDSLRAKQQSQVASGGGGRRLAAAGGAEAGTKGPECGSVQAQAQVAAGPGGYQARRLQQSGSGSSDSGVGVEKLAYAADWLVGGWTQRGVLGYWDPSLTNGLPRQVFAHLVRAPGPTSIGKEAVRMQYGEYNWELAALADGGPFPFLGSSNASELPRVVALLPNVDTTTDSAPQWSNTARGLAQIALLTGRRVVWPAVPCASKWVAPNPGSRRALPLNPNLRVLTHGPFSSGLMCTPAVALHQKCLFERWGGRNDSAADKPAQQQPAKVEEGAEVVVLRREGPRGLLPVEFEMLLRVLPPAAQPGPHNTVHLQSNDDYDDGGGGGERPVMFDEPPRAEGITYVKASDVAGPLREGPLAQQPVLYFAQRTFLTQLHKLGDPAFMAKYRTFRNECPALK